MVKTSDCGSDIHGFESHRAPHNKEDSRNGVFLMRMMEMRTHRDGFEREAAESGVFLREGKTREQNTETRLTPPSKRIPLGAP